MYHVCRTNTLRLGIWLLCREAKKRFVMPSGQRLMWPEASGILGLVFKGVVEDLVTGLIRDLRALGLKGSGFRTIAGSSVHHSMSIQFMFRNGLWCLFIPGPPGSCNSEAYETLRVLRHPFLIRTPSP